MFCRVATGAVLFVQTGLREVASPGKSEARRKEREMAKKMSGRVREALRHSLKYSLSQFLRQLLSDLEVRGAINKSLSSGRPAGLRKYLALTREVRVVENARLKRNLTRAELRSEILAELDRRKAQTAKAREMKALKRKNMGLYLAAKGHSVAVCPDTRHLVPPAGEVVNAPQPTIETPPAAATATPTLAPLA